MTVRLWDPGHLPNGLLFTMLALFSAVEVTRAMGSGASSSDACSGLWCGGVESSVPAAAATLFLRCRLDSAFVRILQRVKGVSTRADPFQQCCWR